MSTLTEAEVNDLMQTEAYTNKNHKDYEKTRREVKQGFENLYPEDDRNSNPEKYYIWRTESDDKVRSEHAKREGEVFLWDETPSGGHPGQDWGCRCKAEQYVPPFDKRHLSKDNDYKHLKFNGKYLQLYKNGKLERSWRAMSGYPAYQEKQYTSLTGKGPLPEGKWIIKQNEMEGYDDKVKGWFTTSLKGERWKGERSSWGDFRIPLHPMTGTNTQGRHSIFLHGGDVLTSAGCLDLSHSMDEFVNHFAEYEEDMMLIVKYDQDKW